MQAVPWKELRASAPGESSAAVKDRGRQIERQDVLNAQLEGPKLRRFCAVSNTGDALLGRAVTRLGLSARAVTRVLRVARTAADLGGVSKIEDAHLAETIQFRLPA